MIRAIEEPELQSFDRLPPHSLEDEMCALGSLMLTGGEGMAFHDTRAILRPEMFYQTDHEIIFKAIVAMAEKHGRFDAMTVRGWLFDHQMLEEVGGVPYLVEVLNNVPSAANGPMYAQRVRELWLRRQIIQIASDAQCRVYAAQGRDETAQAIAQATMMRLSELSAEGRSSEALSIGDILQDVFDKLGAPANTFIPTGISGLDVQTGGIGLGEMVVLGARPSMGKSLIGRQIAFNVAKAGTPVLYISREESNEKIGRNVLSSTCSIDNHRIRRAQLSGDEWKALAEGVVQCAEIPLYVNRSAGTVKLIHAAVSAAVQKRGVKLVVIDYLQRLQGFGDNAYQRVSGVSTGLADLFHDLPVGGLVLAQLSRALLNRDDKRPTLGDLRESGAIEQDADGVLLLHREDYYHTDDSSYFATGIAELSIAKWRDGVRGQTVKLKTNLKYQRFEDLDGLTTQEDPFI